MSAQYNSPTVSERLPAQLFLATLVCVTSAIPSFLWGRGFDIAGMLTGVATFIVVYLVAWNLRPGRRFFAHYHLGRAVRFAYGLRMGLSVVFPLGMALDVYPGMASVNLVHITMGKGEDFVHTLAITLVQGCMLHVGIALFALIAYPFVRLSKKPPAPEGLCTVCGYDLRASPLRCPECGTPCSKLAATMM